jgi:glutamate-5-semialdehyde dehydrogenase
MPKIQELIMEKEYSVENQAISAKNASYRIAAISREMRDNALSSVISAFKAGKQEIFDANKKDLDAAEKGNINKTLIKRLKFDEKKLETVINGIKDLAALDDPVGKILETRELDQELILYKVTVPIGLIGVIFESRPDALVQIACLCIKSANAVILKGGKEALNTNAVLYRLINNAVVKTDSVFKDSIQLVETREDIHKLLKLDNVIDLMIPRGSNALVRNIQENTKIPVLGHADGICHVYIDRDADLKMALEITKDSKCQYPAVCNAAETLLVHNDIAGEFLKELVNYLKGVELRGCERTLKIADMKPADESDWGTEYNDLILSVKIVDSYKEAVEHINKYSSHHTDSIVTANREAADYFLNFTDSSSVLWNCSTRFSDGYRYGLGAEVGISTNKIHSRGPVGLEGLTIYKYRLLGKGQIVADYADGKKKFTHRNL